MNNTQLKKSLIDNWSLEHAGILLDGTFDYHTFSDESFANSLGGMSNYINSLLLYDEINYLANGFESDWTKFSWFEKNTNIFLTPIDPHILNIDWKSEASFADKGIKNYLLTSHILETDLFISPERAQEIKNFGIPEMDDNFSTALKVIDERIMKIKDESWFKNVRIGIQENFIFPSLTHYVFSQTSNSDDLLKVIMQLKASDRIKNIREKINEITSETKNASKFQREIEKLIKRSFGEKTDSNSSWSIGLSVLFLSISKTVNLDFFHRKDYLLFLKDLIACRLETNGLKKDIERIFNRK